MDSKSIIEGLLRLCLIAGVGASITIAPNSAQMLIPVLRKFGSRQSSEHFQEVAYYMRRSQLIQYDIQPDGTYTIKLTLKGKQRMQQIEFDELIVPEPKVWDGNWHLVLFDIPEYQRRARNALTAKLHMLGFYQLQKSVWVYPYPCETIVKRVREAFRIRQQAIVCSEVHAIDRQALLKRHFKLT